MSDERTHSAESAIDDEDPVVGLLTPSEIRFHALRAGDSARAQIEALPQSESRDRLLALQEPIQKFWAEEASDDFCRQWLLVAIGVSR